MAGGEERTIPGGRQEPADEQWISGGESRSGTGVAADRRERWLAVLRQAFEI
jgi:hypothetical protein